MRLSQSALDFLFLLQSKGRDHTSSPFLPEGAVCTNPCCAFPFKAPDQVSRAPLVIWQDSCLVVQLHLHWACCVLLLRSTMNVYSSSTSSDMWWCRFFVSHILFSVLVSICRNDLEMGGSGSLSTENNTGLSNSGVSVCRRSSQASIGNNTWGDAKGSVYNSLLEIHFWWGSEGSVINNSIISLIHTIREWSLLFLWTSFYHATPVALLRHSL